MPDTRRIYVDLLAHHDNLLALIESAAIDLAMDLKIREEVPPGIYEHFKSTAEDTKFYAVHHVARDVDDGPYRVSYESLYGRYARRPALRQLVGESPKTGELDGFLMPVDRPGYCGPRFTLVERSTSPQNLSDIATQYLSRKST